MTDEAVIVVNGTKLTDAQSMTVRVALVGFVQDLVRNGLGDDEHGRTMATEYSSRVREIMRLILNHGPLRGEEK